MNDNSLAIVALALGISETDARELLDSPRLLREAQETIQSLEQEIQEQITLMGEILDAGPSHPLARVRRKNRVGEIAPQVGPFRNAVQAAFRRGKTWSITEEQYLHLNSQPCRYCDGPLGGGIGLDRLNNSLGYAVDNVVPCCGPCNVGKGRTVFRPA